jgi:hypothetical protein
VPLSCSPPCSKSGEEVCRTGMKRHGQSVLSPARQGSRPSHRAFARRAWIAVDDGAPRREDEAHQAADTRRRDGKIVHVFYPVFPPNESARQVGEWLRYKRIR